MRTHLFFIMKSFIEMCVYFLTCCLLFAVLGQDVTITEASIAQSSPAAVTCEFYNHSVCGDWVEGQEPCRVQECAPPSEGKRSHCFAVWNITADGEAVVSLKGCFLNNEECYDKTQCVDTDSEPEKIKFCCCERNMCNHHVDWRPTITEAPPPSTAVPTINKESIANEVIISIYVIIGIILLCCVLVFGFWFKKHKPMFNELPISEPNPVAPSTPYLDLRPIQLIEIKARGRFGAVWKAQFKSEEVAVKIFPIEDKQSWQTEQEIFKLPYMDHANILHFIGTEKRGDNLQTEFWLITAYHERGSLCDYLKAHTLTWNEMCAIAETMARGLMHLHEAIPGKSPLDPVKPAIAHRDFKSKNVLLKSNMTACIADFGLAIVFESGKSCGDTHGQVGTRRYMAPEVLEGAISFTPDAFLRIDMYACGLVLWEIVTRCTAQDGPIPEYRLPFEEEVGPHPTLDNMQESVVLKKVRPVIQDHWRRHPGLAAMCDTMEECWDHDAEARLSASCVMERVMLQKKYPNVGFTVRIETDSPTAPLKENSM